MAGMSVVRLVGVVQECLESRVVRQAVVKSGAASRKYVRKFRLSAFFDPRLDMYLRIANASGIDVAAFGRRLDGVDTWRSCVLDQAVYAHGSLIAFTRETGAAAYTTVHGWVIGAHAPCLSQAHVVTGALGGSFTARDRNFRGAILGTNGGKKTG